MSWQTLKTLGFLSGILMSCADGSAIRDGARTQPADAFDPPDLQIVDARLVDAEGKPDAASDQGERDQGAGAACDGAEYLPPIEEQCDWQAPDQPQCPDGYRCLVVANTVPDAVAVCVAPDCVDIDRDGHGIGPACAGSDCNDCNVNVFEGAAEMCDGLDNDCDGSIDEDIDTQQSPIECLVAGVCEGAEPACRAGEWRCSYGPEHEETEGSCDGLDNDCDGRIDNVDGLGEACSAGQGACVQEGVLVCDGFSGAVTCSAVPLDPLAEQCNGIDDDCDGVIDNVAGVGEECTVNSGSCESRGTRRCDPVRRVLACNAPPPMPRPEACDGRDNDCDSIVDEDCRPVGDPEICNNQDDDNDDIIDEGIEEPCDAACGPGIQRCVAGELGECIGPMGEEEVCNGVDDDCDGATDEELNEICGNGRDDDCDGIADEAGACGACGGLADGTVLEPGMWGACEGFSDACDEIGTQTRTELVCLGGERQQRPVERVCERETDGQQVGGDDWGECTGFDGPCDETGEQTRGRRICRNGVEVGDRESRPCGRDTDDRLVDPGEWGQCDGFVDACDETGRQIRTQRVCRGGLEVAQDDQRNCERNTDGEVIDAGRWEACGEFVDACDETGRQTRIQRVCRDGREALEDDVRACERETDGTVVDRGAWGRCEGFADQCDETGQQARQTRICRDGRERLEDEMQNCTRETDGEVVDIGRWGQCGGFSDQCDETGREERTRRVCRNGREQVEDESRECRRFTDGEVVSVGNWGQCGGFFDACDESGREERTRRVCRNGRESVENDSRACNRDTDGEPCPGGQCDNGRCAPREVCNLFDDDGNGIVDDPAECWMGIARFRGPNGERCLGEDRADRQPPPRCAGYQREIFAFITARTPVAGTYRARQCSKRTDHIIVEFGSADYNALVRADYDCRTELGYIFRNGAPDNHPFARQCPLYRFRYTVAGGSGAHLFTRGADNVNGMVCEPPTRGVVLTEHPCFNGPPDGCR